MEAVIETHSQPKMLGPAAFQGGGPAILLGPSPFCSQPFLFLSSPLLYPLLFLIPFPFPPGSGPKSQWEVWERPQLLSRGPRRSSGHKSIFHTFWARERCVVATILILFVRTKMSKGGTVPTTLCARTLILLQAGSHHVHECQRQEICLISSCLPCANHSYMLDFGVIIRRFNRRSKSTCQTCCRQRQKRTYHLCFLT